MMCPECNALQLEAAPNVDPFDAGSFVGHPVQIEPGDAIVQSCPACGPVATGFTDPHGLTVAVAAKVAEGYASLGPDFAFLAKVTKGAALETRWCVRRASSGALVAWLGPENAANEDEG